MKRAMYIFLCLCVALTTTSCALFGPKKPISTSDYSLSSSVFVPFNVLGVKLSKAFDNIGPNVRLRSTPDKYEIQISPGAVVCSSFDVSNIFLQNDNLFIRLFSNNSFESTNIRVYNPVIIVEIDKEVAPNLKDENIKLIHENYSPLTITVSKKQAITEALRLLNLAPSVSPRVDLVIEKDKPLWSIDIINGINKETQDLHDAKLIIGTSEAKLISHSSVKSGDFLLNGELLTLSNDESSLLVLNKNSLGNYEMAIYDIVLDKSTIVYTTTNQIHWAGFSPDNSKIAIMEGDLKLPKLLVMDLDGSRREVVSTIEHNRVYGPKWIDNSTLFFISLKDKSSSIMAYDLKLGSSKRLFSLDAQIEEFDFYNINNILLTVVEELNIRRIYTLNLNSQAMIYVNDGFRPRAVKSTGAFTYFRINPEDKENQVFNLKKLDAQKNITDLYNSPKPYDYGIINDKFLYLITNPSPEQGYIVTISNLDTNESLLERYIPGGKVLIDNKLSNAYVEVEVTFPDGNKGKTIYRLYL